MKNPLRLFAIRKDERWLALVSVCLFTLMHTLLMYAHWDRFTIAKHGHIGAWSLFNNQLLFSGYDPYAYMTITQFSVYYTLERHPLLTVALYPFYLLNHWIMVTFDFNAAMLIIGCLVVVVATYSALFMYRVLHELLSLRRTDSIWLTALLFSFASVLTSSMSPDHFIFSFFMLMMSIYIFGRCIKQGRQIAWYKATVLYLLTTGLTLTNGVKTLLGVLFTDGKHTFHWKNVLFVLIIPSALLLGAYYVQYQELVIPHQEMSTKMIQKKIEKNPSLAAIDSINRIKSDAVSGEKVSDKPFLKWIDASSSRTDGIIEGLFGESFQLHRDYLLGDVYLGRPKVIHYRSWVNYAINAVVVLLFIGGLLVGYRERLLQMLLSWWAIDLMIHIVLGFGINEVSINGAHWLFIIPISIGYLYARLSKKSLNVVRYVVAALTIYLWCYNGYLVANYMIHL